MDGGDGQVVAVRFRRDDTFDEEGPKYWGLRGHNDALLYDPAGVIRNRWVILCEGELDALLCVQEGLPAVSFTNGTTGIKRDAVSLFQGEVYLALDQDRAGREAAARMLAWLGGRGRTLSWEGAKDVTELRQQGRWTEFLTGLPRTS